MGKAVFLSYASQDAEGAKRICEALRAAGVEVWFDQSELRGGDAWDAKIRKQIKECALFVPIISANTQARLEGYFRLEWKLAEDRSHLMARGKPFIVPVVIDDSGERDAHVPDSFLAVQWTRLPAGDATAAFAARIVALLTGEAIARRPSGFAPGDVPTVLPRRPGPTLTAGFIALAIVAAVVIWSPWRRTTPSPTTDSSEIARVRKLADQGTASREDLALAVALARRLAQSQPENAEAWAWESIAQSLQNLRGYDVSAATLQAARRAAERALSIKADSSDAALAMGLHLANMVGRGGDVTAGEAYLKRAAAGADSDLVHLGLAIFWREAWRLEDAARECEIVLARNPRDPLAAYLLGGVRAWQRRPEEGARLREMASSAGGLLGIRATVGWALIKFFNEGDVPGMRAVLARLEPSARLDARAVVAFWNAGYWERNGDVALQAIATLPDSYILDNYFYGPKAVLTGLAHRLAGRAEPARLQFEEGERLVRERLRQDPEDDMVRLRLAQVLALLGRAADARRELQAIESVIAARPPSLNRQIQRGVIARIHAELGDVEAALPYLRELLLAPHMTTYRSKSFALDPDWDRVRGDPRVQAIVDEAGRKSSATSAPVAAEKSLAVLAFRQLSADPENEYLCEAISDELCNVLGRVPGLRVAASASAFSFKGKRVRPAEMAAQLGVAYLVDGTVQKIGNRVRVSAELIKAADETSVWRSGTLEHQVKDMFALQDAVVGAIAKNLQLRLTGEAEKPVVVANAEAYRLYYEGRRAWSMRSLPSEAEHAKALFQQAVALDSSLGRAYAGLVDVTLNYNPGLFGARDSADMREVLALADRAVNLEPSSAEAHTSKGRALWQAWRTTEAERELRAALALNPSHAEAHQLLGRLLHHNGYVDESLAEMAKAAELDPLTSRIFSNFSLMLCDVGFHRDALVQADRALGLQPASVQARRARMRALSGLGRHAEALEIDERVKGDGDSLAVLILTRTQRIAEAKEAAAAIRSPNSRNVALAATGQYEELLRTANVAAFSALQVGSWLYWPEFDPVRGDPRFVRLLEQLGLKEADARAQAWRATHPPQSPVGKK